MYSTQTPVDVFGVIGTPITLTGSYVTKIIPIQHIAETYIAFEYTTGAAGVNNVLDIKMESSIDPSDGGTAQGTPTPRFNQDLTNSVAAGAVTLSDQEFHYTGVAGATTYARGFLYPVAAKQLRISVKETVVVGAAGTLLMRVLLSGI